MRVLICSLSLAFFGCSQNRTETSSFFDAPPPPPPPNILPDTAPPKYIPQFENIQVNTIPHPFNINGRMPFAVWVDGQKLPINSKESKAIVQALDIKFKQPKDTAQIHRGEGWLYPKKINAQ